MSFSSPNRALGLALATVLCACAVTAPPEAAEPIAIDGETVALHGERYLEYRVGINIAAPPERIWALLTDAPNYPEWNTTIDGIDGAIALDEEIELKAKIDPDRTFDLTVSTFDEPTKLVWQDGGKAFRGVRTFTLMDKGDGTTDVTMAEVLSGSMMGMIEDKLPDFRPSFTAFAVDLKAAAEAG